MSEIVVGELESRRMGFTQSPHTVHQRGGVVSFPSLLGAPSSLQTLTDLACANMYSARLWLHIISGAVVCVSGGVVLEFLPGLVLVVYHEIQVGKASAKRLSNLISLCALELGSSCHHPR